MMMTCRGCGAVQRQARCPSCTRQANRAYGPTHRALRVLVLEANAYTCAVCGEHATTADHVIPVANGGKAEPSNYVALCLSCNGQRGSRSFAEFLSYRRSLGLPVRPELVAQLRSVFLSQNEGRNSPPSFEGDCSMVFLGRNL